MRRRVVYSLIGIVTANLVAMAAMFLHMRNDDECDTSARGLVVWMDDRERWETLSLPEEPTGLPPCRARLERELKMLPG